MEITKAQEIVDQWINTLGVRYFNELTNSQKKKFRFHKLGK